MKLNNLSSVILNNKEKKFSKVLFLFTFIIVYPMTDQIQQHIHPIKLK